MDLKTLLAARAMRAENDGFLVVVKRPDGSWSAMRGDVNLADFLKAALHPDISPPIVIPDPPEVPEVGNELPGRPGNKSVGDGDSRVQEVPDPKPAPKS